MPRRNSRTAAATRIAYNDDGFFSGLQFRIRASLSSGTYYVRVASLDGEGVYSVLVETVTEPAAAWRRRSR